MSRITRRTALEIAGRAIGGAAVLASAGRAAQAQQPAARRRRALVIGRQPLSGASVAITRHMMETRLLEAEAAALGYDITIDWRDFPNAGPIMELLRAGPEAMSFAFVGNTPVVTGIANNVPLQVVSTGEGTQPFFLLVRPGSDIRKIEDLRGKTIGTFVGLDPHNAFIQSLRAELNATPDQLGIRFQNFPEFPVLARLPRGIDAAGMIPWSPAYSAIAQGQAAALFDTRGITGPAHERGAGQRLSGIDRSPFRPEGFYQFRPFWICHADIMRSDPDLVLAWLIAYQKGLLAIKAAGAQRVAEANQGDWRQPPAVGVDIIGADLVWNRGWTWLTEGDLVSVVGASAPLVAARSIPRPVTWDVMRQHVAPIAPLQRTAWERLGSVPAMAEFEKPDSEISDLRGLPTWRAQEWGRYADRI